MKTSEKIDMILSGLRKVKSELQAVTKSASNPFFKSKYADLNTHLDAVEPLLEKNGLILLQPVSVNEATGANTVSSIIIDPSGQFVSSQMTVVAKENDMQKLGSAITYARRYTLGALLSMKAEDDDGNVASDKASKNNSFSRKESLPEVDPSIQKSDKPDSKLLTTRPSFKRLAKTAAATTVAPVTNGNDI